MRRGSAGRDDVHISDAIDGPLFGGAFCLGRGRYVPGLGLRLLEKLAICYIFAVARSFSFETDSSEHTGRPMKKRSKKAFWGGFWGGVAAPLALFSNFSAPTVHEPQISPLYRPARSSNEALRNDVRRIGDDFGRSIKRHDGSR